jgi:hypothetical protein
VIDVDVAMQVGGVASGLGNPEEAILRELIARPAARSRWRSTRSTR